MKLGLIARAESRGLGHMTRQFHDHMHPDRTLVLIPAGVARHGLQSHLDWYPDGHVLRFDGHLDEKACRRWLHGLDVVYTAETFYDWRFCHWARQAGVRTICHLMPEWLPKVRSAEPDRWWAPTSWRLDRCPPGTTVVPVPVPDGQTTARLPVGGGPFRWLHVAGAQTHGDRNGTVAVTIARELLNEPQTVTVRAQTPIEGFHRGPVENPEDLYTGVDAVVMPRRYGGLSLPVLESFGAGLPVLMSDVPPQSVEWPVGLVPTTPGDPEDVYGNRIDTADTDPVALAAAMDEWATSPEIVKKWRGAAHDYAAAHSWTVMADRYRELLTA